tara:strand:- start:637 stop:786 length:150 start_codon:yes stop_codon:yes gene_type:complete
MMRKNKKSLKPKTRNWIQAMHIEQNRKAGAHRVRSKYNRKVKHKGQNGY